MIVWCDWQVAEKLSKCHCEERFSRRGNLEVIGFFKTEISSLCSQRRQKDFFSDLLVPCALRHTCEQLVEKSFPKFFRCRVEEAEYFVSRAALQQIQERGEMFGRFGQGFRYSADPCFCLLGRCAGCFCREGMFWPLLPDAVTEEFIRFDVVDAAERQKFLETWVCLFARFQTRNISLGDPAALVRRKFGKPRDLAHGHFIFISQFIELFCERHNECFIPFFLHDVNKMLQNNFKKFFYNCKFMCYIYIHNFKVYLNYI